jgi:hypothetical protein
MVRRSRRIKEEPEPKVPEEGEIAQRRGHGGGKKENGMLWKDRNRRAQGSD